MYRHAAKSAAQPNSFLKAPRSASVSCHPRKEVCSNATFSGTIAARNETAVEANIRCRGTEDDLGASGSLPPRIPSSARGHASGPNRRPAARRRSASLAAPLRALGSSQKKFESRSKERCTNFFRAPPRKHSLALGSRAHSLGFACVTRARYGNSTKRRSPPCTQTKSPSSDSSATTQRFAPTTTAA